MSQIKISEVIDCLNKGMKRDQVAEHFGISKSECTKLFKHPKLKGLQARKPLSFDIVDDTQEPVAEERASAVEVMEVEFEEDDVQFNN